MTKELIGGDVGDTGLEAAARPDGLDTAVTSGEADYYSRQSSLVRLALLGLESRLRGSGRLPEGVRIVFCEDVPVGGELPTGQRTSLHIGGVALASLIAM